MCLPRYVQCSELVVSGGSLVTAFFLRDLMDRKNIWLLICPEAYMCNTMVIGAFLLVPYQEHQSLGRGSRGEVYKRISYPKNRRYLDKIGGNNSNDGVPYSFLVNETGG